MLAAENPFSSKFVRPGAVAYRFPAGASAARIVEQFVAAGRRGAIVGPHGSGKSTLLEAVDQEFARRGWAVVRFALHEGETRLANDWRGHLVRRPNESNPLVVVVDGYEQLTWWAAWKLQRTCHRLGAGLLVSAHEAVRYPTIYETAPDEAQYRVIVAALLGQADGKELSQQAIARAWHAANGNVREALFTLYDEYERQRRC